MAQEPVVDKIYTLIGSTANIIRMGEDIMANQAELLAKIADLQAGQTELLKDVRRLIAEGDTTAAISALDTVITANETLDAEVEAASPEPTAEPTPEPEPVPAPEATPGE